MIETLFRERPLVGLLVLLHAAAILAGAGGLALRRRKVAVAAAWVLGLAFAVNTVVLIDRWIEAGRPPFKTLYETLLFYPWCVSVVTLTLIAMYRIWALAPSAAAACLAGLVYAVARPDTEIVNLPPALQSGWFVPHVVTYFVSYAALFASFLLAALALAKPQWRAPGSGAGLEEYAHRSVMFGFATLTMGLVMGAVWGKEAWGDYWSWDPKENWALVTFLAYLVYLHLRFVRGWQGRRAMMTLVASFAAVVFTYLGMSLLPSTSDSLHVYQ